jgi:hypothetical protein
MANKCEDEFNPWPSFVDIFSSVILVLLLFLLVVLVNLGYYAQFKYKVSYTGSIATDDLILNDNPSDAQTKKEIQEESSSSSKTPTISEHQTPAVAHMQGEIIRLKKIIEERIVKAKEKKESAIESGGIDVADRKDDDKTSKQSIFESDEYFIVTYKGNEIFLDNEIAKKLKVFILKLKKKYKKHKIAITSSDVKGLASATIAKQISLARSIGTRNLIRKFGYEKKDVRIDLLAKTKVKEEINESNGYLIIRIKR